METSPKAPMIAEVAAPAVATPPPTNDQGSNAAVVEFVPAVPLEVEGASGAAQGTAEGSKKDPDAAQHGVKRGRGRPKGSGNKPKLAPIGALPADTAAKNWVPYVMTVEAGEDIRETIFEFAQNVSVSSCVLSAVGPVYRAHLSLSSSRVGCVRYEGHFEIVFLSASHTLRYMPDGRYQTASALSIKLASPDGNIFGGYATGPVIAAGPVQIVMASFEQEKRNPLKVSSSAQRSMPSPSDVLPRDISAELQVQSRNGKHPIGNMSINVESLSSGPAVTVQTAYCQTPVTGDQQIPDGTNQPCEPVPSTNGKMIDSEVVLVEPIASLPFQHQCSELGEGNDNNGGQKDEDVPTEFPVMQNASSRSEPI